MAKTVSEILSHWHRLIEGLGESPYRIYASLEDAVIRREMRGIKISRINYREGRMFSTGRSPWSSKGVRASFVKRLWSSLAGQRETPGHPIMPHRSPARALAWWKWTFASALIFFASISSSSGQPAPLHPGSPRYFRGLKADPVVFIGDYTWGTFSQVDYEFEAVFDTLKANGLNFSRVWVWWGCEEFPEADDGTHFGPYLRTGPGVAEDGKPKYDLTRFNPTFFERLKSLCTAARDRGIFLQLTLFDAWMLKHEHLWKLHAYHHENNINGVDGDPKNTGTGTDGGKGFCSMGNPKVLDAQKALIRKVVDTLNDFDNIFFEIANENYYNAEWERHLCQFIHEYEKGRPKQHLVMPLDLPNHDYGGIKTWDLRQLRAALLKARDLKQPLIFDTDGIGCPDDATVRKAAWTAFVSGGHASYLDDSLQTRTEHKGDFKGSRREVLRRQLSYLAAFADRVRFWDMEPQETLVKVGEAFVMSSPSEVIAYLPNGETVTLDLSKHEGVLIARWFNPRDGTFSEPFKVQGGNQQGFDSPSGDDWVLHLREGGSER